MHLVGGHRLGCRVALIAKWEPGLNEDRRMTTYRAMAADDRDDQRTPEETARRSDELLRHMVNRPPQPHATHRPGQPRSRKPTVSDRARRAKREAPDRDNT